MISFDNSIAFLHCIISVLLYLANISLDVGSFYAVRNDYLNAVKIFNWAYIPFKNNSHDKAINWFVPW